jgi:hypothetical protein
MRKSKITATVIVLLAGQVFGQDKPAATFAETTDWIQRTCSVHADRQKTAFDGYSVSGFWYRPDDNFFFWFATISLKDVESVSIKSGMSPSMKSVGKTAKMEIEKTPCWDIQLVTKNKFPAHMNRPSGPSQPEDHFAIRFVDKDMAERMLAAFTHAVELAKAQKEPF